MRTGALPYGTPAGASPDPMASTADEAFAAAVRARVEAQYAKYETSLPAACELWGQINGLCDDEGWAALRELEWSIKLDPFAWETYMHFRDGVNTPQVEVVERLINEADRNARDAAQALRNAA